MDLSSHFEERLDAALKNNKQNTGDQNETPLELTQEIIDKQFYDFEKMGDLIGKFEGPGPVFQMTLKEKRVPIDTWRFKMPDGKTWLLPQWQSLDEPQGNFKGFKNETAGEWSYIIQYISKEQLANGIRHNIKVFRRKF